MKSFKLVLGCLFIMFCSCSDEGNLPEVSEDYIAESKYLFSVTSSIGNDFTVEGETTNFRPLIRHMSLGPDIDNTCVLPAASMAMNSTDTNFDFQDLTTIRWDVDLTFYSILYWCEDLGNQESNFYTAPHPNNITQEEYEYGIDATGVKFFKGTFVMVFNREAINEADVDEEIVVFADFVAVDR